jgi:hypothetical protein
MENLVIIFISLVLLWIGFKLVIKFFWLALFIVAIIVWANWGSESSNDIEEPKTITVAEEKEPF